MVDITTIYTQVGLELQDGTWSWNGNSDMFPLEVQKRIINSDILNKAISKEREKLAALGFIDHIATYFGEECIKMIFGSMISDKVRVDLWVSDVVCSSISIIGYSCSYNIDVFSHQFTWYMNALRAAKKAREACVEALFVELPQPIAEEIECEFL